MFGLLRGLDALGDDVDAQAAPEVDDRADDLAAFSLRALHERRIDLQLVDREAMQIAERGVAGAEVVDSKTAAELANALDDRERHFRILHDRALGDLEMQCGRI